VQYFAGAIIVIVLIILFNTARGEARKEARRADRLNFVVRAPKFYRIAGVAVTAVFVLLFILVLTLGGSSIGSGEDGVILFAGLVFGVFFLLGAFILLYSIRWKLNIVGDDLVLTPVFGRERSYSVREITHIKTANTGGIQIYIGSKKIFSVDAVSIGSNMRIAYFIEKGVKTPDKIKLGWGRGQI
jgi:hypothetical protein